LIKLSSRVTGEFWEIAVLFEDEQLLALNKPPGLLISPDRDDPTRPNLMKLLHSAIAEEKAWAKERGLAYLANAHRLDCETSGVLLLAKSKPVLLQVADLFRADTPLQTYLALLPGTPPHPQWEVDAPIGPDPAHPGLMRVSTKHGKRCRTRFEVREQFRGFTLVQCRPVGARTHQIRVHLKHWGLATCGDQLYGGGPLLLSQLKPDYRLKPGHTERPLIATLALHAERMEFLHPVTAQPVVIAADWPKDLAVAVKYLRRYSPV